MHLPDCCISCTVVDQIRQRDAIVNLAHSRYDDTSKGTLCKDYLIGTNGDFNVKTIENFNGSESTPRWALDTSKAY